MKDLSFSEWRKKGVIVWARGNIDLTILLMTIILVCFGIVMVFSSSYYESDRKFSNPMHFAVRQGVYALIGMMVAVPTTMVIDIKVIRKLSFFLYAFFNFLLLLVLFIGASANGAQRWISILGFQFQPSDFAKITTILFLANYLANLKEGLRTFRGFIGALFILGVPCALIGIENASTSIIIALVGMIMIFTAGVRWREMFLLAGIGGIGLLVLLTTQGYRLKRIDAWLHPEEDMSGSGYQILQSLYAISSGGIFGVGFDNSRQKLGFIPESYNDIIFAIICEELGFFGAMILVIVFGFLIWRGYVVAFNAPDEYTTHVAIGITSLIALQVVLNIAVATNTLPNTGVALPFISYGGSSVIAMLWGIGILLNISRIFYGADAE